MLKGYKLKVEYFYETSMIDSCTVLTQSQLVKRKEGNFNKYVYYKYFNKYKNKYL